MIDNSRFANLINPTSDVHPLFVGVGSVGSNLVRAVASIGVSNAVVYDDDRIGRENIAVSWLEGVGNYKVDDISSRVWELYNMRIRSVSERVTPPDVASEIEEGANVVIMSPDSIGARRDVWRGIVLADVSSVLVVDFRIGGYGGNCYSFYYGDVAAQEQYKTTLNNRGTGLPCGEKAYPGITLGWCPMVIVDILARHVGNVVIPYSHIANMSIAQEESKYYHATL